MTSNALPSRRQAACLAAVASLAVAAAALGANPFADRFPNLVLKTHEGKNVRFYDDLLKGRIVLINFMYATCTRR